MCIRASPTSANKAVQQQQRRSSAAAAQAIASSSSIQCMRSDGDNSLFESLSHHEAAGSRLIGGNSDVHEPSGGEALPEHMVAPAGGQQHAQPPHTTERQATKGVLTAALQVRLQGSSTHVDGAHIAAPPLLLQQPARMAGQFDLGGVSWGIPHAAPLPLHSTADTLRRSSAPLARGI